MLMWHFQLSFCETQYDKSATLNKVGVEIIFTKKLLINFTKNYKETYY